MQQDRYGNTLSTSSAAAATAYDVGVDHILAATEGAQAAFAEAIAADEGFALAHVGAARAAMYAGDMGAIKPLMARATALADGVSEREKAHIAMFDLLFAGKPVEARAAVEAHVLDHPRDAMVAQVCTNIFGLIGFSGEPGREAALLAYTGALLPHYGDDWWMGSMHALSLTEVGQTGAALEMMEASLARNNANANGSHFKAHALYEEGRTAEGRAYLDDWMDGYAPEAVLHGHLSWHQALWALQDGDWDAMWGHYRRDIAPEASHALPINVLTDGAALLWRAEMAGAAVEAEDWRKLSAYATQYFPNPTQSFADMHAALAHAMAGEGAALAKLTEASKGYAAELVQPVARAWGAVARGDWAGAVQDLTPVMADHARLGGSKAQRDLLELTWLLCLMRSGAKQEARRAAATRRPLFAKAAPVQGFAA
ncbi:tetratricopeptide repeat protein [Rhodobacteraceae bacterium N5(2021)]|uniref:Tetratricopeptide repeat protein 38 n=1 Tax=Gymnodinialimonas phycosphaerae TaxID=2841589 RepID=A0A975TU16_9RHOB|nr:tetratricopeptide repeat protein [Gymnodinialimonas phycosphaerae]MBY4894806.1 tetratricopeptide repeat protein [Gymnodinialimonas phycosphaerae]